MSSCRYLSVLLVACFAAAACGSDKPDPGTLTVLVRAADRPLIEPIVAKLPPKLVILTTVADPVGALPDQPGAAIALTTRADCSECYRMDRDDRHVTVKGGAKLGLQYGLANALEAFGFRFNHPRHAFAPARIALDTSAGFAKEHAPQVDQRRGLHLHTLHPIESMFDFWEPGADHLQGALDVLDFTVANRGNYVQWCALNDIITPTGSDAAWQEHTRSITKAAHDRGMHVGIAIQLFGSSNLQKAFDLTDSDQLDAAEMAKRLHLLLDGNGFDTVNISFGEFTGADPALFVASLDQAYAAIQAVQPGIEVVATIHVGNYPNLQVTYQGKTQLYYFLVQYANPAIVPWIHTVMYYDLFEDAGLAYLHENFNEHKQFLVDRMQAGKKVGYFPETAYWITFDCTVPMFLPLYVRSRWTDLDGLSKLGHLADHVLFSSGWEWGYWLNDVTSLRMGYERPATWGDAVRQVFAAWGEKGKKVGELVIQLGDAQHDALIGQRLAPFLAGRDVLLDLGDKMGKIAAPTRPALDGIAKLSDAQRADVATKVAQMAQFSDQLAGIASQFEAIDDSGDAWLQELHDGVAVTALRARFVHRLWAAALQAAAGPVDATVLNALQNDIDAAKTVIERRRGALWDGSSGRLELDGVNPTVYQYGYLRDAHSLCFWRRELIQLRNFLTQAGEDVPNCVL